LSVRSVGAEVWKVLLREHGGWWRKAKAGNNAVRERKCVRDGVCRAMRVRREDMTSMTARLSTALDGTVL
jgi:hypothetical protein